MKYLSALKNKNLSDKICLLRVDLNIENEELRDTHPRIRAILPTIRFLIEKGVKVVILSHRGRPKTGIMNNKLGIKNFTLKPFAKIFSKLLNKSVRFIDFKKGFNPALIRRSVVMARHNIFLLENLRFFSGEEKNDRKFAAKLASLGDFYVNDGFGVSHRKDASVAAITKYLPSYAGLLLEREVENLDKVLRSPRLSAFGPRKFAFVIILGGAKVSDKINLIKNFLKKADYILIGGAAANIFFAAKNLPIGESLYEKNVDLRGLAYGLARNKKVLLPIDVVIDKGEIMDIGPKTIKKYSEIVKKAGTVIWNGPMGYIENPRFAKGSKAVARAITKSRAFSVVGGGETASLFHNSYFLTHNSRVFISTGGGAMLEYLAGKKLPGLEALRRCFGLFRGT